jgi:hypothetical protein
VGSEGREFLILQSVQTGPVAHPSARPVPNGFKATRVWCCPSVTAVKSECSCTSSPCRYGWRGFNYPQEQLYLWPFTQFFFFKLKFKVTKLWTEWIRLWCCLSWRVFLLRVRFANFMFLVTDVFLSLAVYKTDISLFLANVNWKCMSITCNPACLSGRIQYVSDINLDSVEPCLILSHFLKFSFCQSLILLSTMQKKKLKLYFPKVI